jgi:anti-sigma factor RsiW
MSDQLNLSDLQAYQSGQLSGPARHRVERLLLENPFYADALAGLEAMQQTATPTAEQLSDLRDALHERIHASANQKRLWPLWIATTTAAILFMLAMAIYFIFFANKRPHPPKPTATQSITNSLFHSPDETQLPIASSTESVLISVKLRV